MRIVIRLWVAVGALIALVLFAARNALEYGASCDCSHCKRK